MDGAFKKAGPQENKIKNNSARHPHFIKWAFADE